MDNILEFPNENLLSDKDIVNLFMGLVRLVRRQYQDRINALETRLSDLLGDNDNTQSL